MLHTFHGIRQMMLRCLIISGVHFYHSVKVVLVKFLHHEIIIFLNKYLMGIYFKIMKYLVFLHCCTLTLTSIDDSYLQLLLLCCLSDGDFSIFLFIFNNWNYKEELCFLPPLLPPLVFFFRYFCKYGSWVFILYCTSNSITVIIYIISQIVPRWPIEILFRLSPLFFYKLL